MPFPSDTARRLVDLGVATLSESTPRRHPPTGLRLLVGEPFAGPAVTVDLPAGDNLGVHLAVEAATAGDVVCVASRGRGLYGVVGELLTEAARARGIAGLVLDDGIRDLEALVVPPAVAARGTSPRGTAKRRVRRAVNADVSLGGALVAAGDWIVCDRDGVCVVPADRLEAVVEAAEARAERETGVREQLRTGRTTKEVFGLPGDAPASV